MKAKNNPISTFEEHINKQYGKRGSAKRTKFENKAKAYIFSQGLMNATQKKPKNA